VVSESSFGFDGCDMLAGKQEDEGDGDDLLKEGLHFLIM
jgi:hypothetical protein